MFLVPCVSNIIPVIACGGDSALAVILTVDADGFIFSVNFISVLLVGYVVFVIVSVRRSKSLRAVVFNDISSHFFVFVCAVRLITVLNGVVIQGIVNAFILDNRRIRGAEMCFCNIGFVKTQNRPLSSIDDYFSNINTIFLGLSKCVIEIIFKNVKNNFA